MCFQNTLDQSKAVPQEGKNREFASWRARVNCRVRPCVAHSSQKKERKTETVKHTKRRRKRIRSTSFQGNYILFIILNSFIMFSEWFKNWCIKQKKMNSSDRERIDNMKNLMLIFWDDHKASNKVWSYMRYWPHIILYHHN